MVARQFVFGPWNEWFRNLWRQRMKPWLDRNYWIIMGLMWGSAFGLGYWGWLQHFQELGEKRTCWDMLYLTLQLFTVESGSVFEAVPWQLDIARFLAPTTTLYTALAALTLIFRDQLQTFRIRLLQGHVVICGLGRRGFLLAQAFLERRIPVVVVERDTGNDWLNACRDQGAIIVYGDASDENVLCTAGVQRADCVIAVCGEDGTNAEIAVDCRNLVRHRHGRPLKCVAQIEDPELCHLLRGLELAMIDPHLFRLEFFNSHIRGAKLVLEEYPPFKHWFGDLPHLLIIGIGRMGENLAVHAAKLWRKQRDSHQGRLKITLIDRNATDKKKLILLKNPLLEDVCELTAFDLDVKSAEFVAGAFLLNGQGNCSVNIVYICLDDDARALAAALAIFKHVRGQNVPIIVRTSRQGGLGILFQQAEQGRQCLGALHAFGLLEKTCTPELVLGGTHEILAKTMYEKHVANGCFNQIFLTEPLSGSWHGLSKEYQNAYRRRADYVVDMIRAVNCTLETLTEWEAEEFSFTAEEEDLLAHRLHDAVISEQKENVVRIPPGFGGIPLSLPHSAAIPWERQSQQVRDWYKAEIRHLPAFLAHIDFQIYRLS